MRAAVVHDWHQPPRFDQFADPEAQDGELLIEVAAAALSNLVKGQASGSHYTSGKDLPMVPGIDGVGRTADGRRVYFMAARKPFGAMAERTVVASGHTILLPDAVDDLAGAALGNPGLASWAALIGRAGMQAGETVLLNGATGVSGQQAVQAAKRLGAKHVIVTGRNPKKLEALRALGADETIALDQPEDQLRSALRKALKDDGGTQVVLDYLWGRSAELLLEAASGHGSQDGEPRLRFVQIGAMSGQNIQLAGAWLRSSGVELLGSGFGSLSLGAMLQALGRMYEAHAQSPLQIEIEAVPLEQVESAWNRTESGCRTVFTIGH